MKIPLAAAFSVLLVAPAFALVPATETFLKDPSDFEALFARCLQMISVSRAELSAALAQRASNPA